MSKRTVAQQRNLVEWLEYLEKQHTKSIDLGLERISQVANALSVLPPAPQVVLVAGTNGKGSTVRYLEEILLAQGYRTGSYTSPHFLRYNERVRVNGAELSDQAHCEAFAAVEQARANTPLTYFEFGTLAALYLLKQAQLDVVVLEIGLGGRLDAVNIVEPDVSVVTSVGVDHIEFLGTDREQIGFEKAGVYRAGKPAICADPNPPQRLIEHAQAIGAQLCLCGEDYKISVEHTNWTFSSEKMSFKGLPKPFLPLPNAAAAIAALSYLSLDITRPAIESGLRQARLSGRLEVRSGSPLVVLDVAHNPHAANYLAEQLQQRWPDYTIRAVCGMLSDKDAKNTLKPLTRLVDYWYLATLPGPRGNSAEALSEQLQSGQKECFDNVELAYKQALADAKTSEIVLCFGSFLTIQAIYELEGPSGG